MRGSCNCAGSVTTVYARVCIDFHYMIFAAVSVPLPLSRCCTTTLTPFKKGTPAPGALFRVARLQHQSFPGLEAFQHYSAPQNKHPTQTPPPPPKRLSAPFPNFEDRPLLMCRSDRKISVIGSRLLRTCNRPKASQVSKLGYDMRHSTEMPDSHPCSFYVPGPSLPA